jgi:hypothetical protein
MKIQKSTFDFLSKLKKNNNEEREPEREFGNWTLEIIKSRQGQAFILF